MHGGRRTFSGGRNRGQVIVIFTVILLVLLGFAALGIDVGYMYSVKNDLQRSADAGALAGAYAFHDGGWAGGPIPPALQGRVENRALFFATRDPVGAAPLPGGAITFAYPRVNQIQVTAQTNVNLFFAGVIGSPTVLLSATAVAEAIVVDQNIECLTPLAFPYPYIDGPSTIPPFNKAWDPGETVLPITQGLPVTFQVANTPNAGIPGYVMNGDSVTGIGGAGEIFPILMCGDGFNDDPALRARIQNPCGDGCNAISINDIVSLKGNETHDPTINEINSSIIPGDPTGFWPPGGYPLPDSRNPNYFQANDLWMYSPRVMRVMLYDPQIARTSGVIRVDGFAGFWVQDADNSVPNRTITGYLIPATADGDSSGSPVLIEPSLKKTTGLVQ